MSRIANISMILVLLLVTSGSRAEVTTGPAAIQKVEIRDRAFHVNGEPFFPIMIWLQSPANFAISRECGINTATGFTRGGRAQSVKDYLDLAREGGLYGVMPFREEAKGHPALLGWIHGDEPDLTHPMSDAVVEPASNLTVNRSNPLWKIFDGVTHSWSVLDPLEGASFTVKLKEPVMINSLAVSLTISPGLSVAKELAFEANGKEILRAKLEPKRDPQKFNLPESVTVRELSVKVLSAEPGTNAWGSIGEIEGFDKDGKNVLLSPPRDVPNATPDKTLREYERIKAGDASRPVFMTLTGNFHPFLGKNNEERLKLYPEYVKATDVVGYDIYPIYGWNKPEWIHLVSEATDLLVRMSEPRPVYAWIETSKGSQWTGALENQKDVKPEHIRAEVWMCICRGATSIGYFTHIWKPEYRQFGVPPENQKALAEINAQITRLTPAILGEKPNRAVSIESEGGVKLDAMAKQLKNGLYIFTVNSDEKMRPAQGTIRVEGLAAGTEVTVVDENRTIRSEAGSFTDRFEPLAVHIYKIP